MNRIRWFRLGVKSELATFARQLASKVFVLDDAVSSGFRIEKRDKTEIIGQFIHKKTIDQTVALPSGEEFTQEVASIEVTRFGVSAFSSDLLLHTLDAPRSSTNFLSSLSEATKFSCTVDPIEVDVKVWIEQIASACDRVSATYLDVTGIKVSETVQGRLALSGQGDVYEAMTSFVGSNAACIIESAKISFVFDGINYILELGRRATIKAPAAFPYKALDAIRKAMLASIIDERK